MWKGLQTKVILVKNRSFWKISYKLWHENMIIVFLELAVIKLRKIFEIISRNVSLVYSCIHFRDLLFFLCFLYFITFFSIKKKMWYDCQWDNRPQETKMTQKLTNICHRTAFNNEQSPYRIVSYKRPRNDNVKQFKRVN